MCLSLHRDDFNARTFAPRRRTAFGYLPMGLGQAPTVPALPQSLALPPIFNGTSAQTSWNQIAAQIQAEGPLPQGSVSDRLATAQSQYLAKLQSFIDSGITQVQPDLSSLAGAAQSATLATNTVLGAVNAVQGITNGISSGNAQQVESGVQALVGIIASIAVATGAASAGVGAAIGGAIELTFVILNAAGILPSLPPGSVNVGDGHCSNMGFTSPGQPSVGGVIPADLKSDLSNPGANGEGVCVWGTLVSPNSANWRYFPDPTNTNDVSWFTTYTEATWTWPAGVGQAKWYTKNTGNWRPIDNAFHVYRTLECEGLNSYELANGAGPGNSTSLASLGFLRVAAATAFLQAYFHMWKKNKEFELNGLNSAPDTAVLEQLVAVWNTAHEPGDGLDFFASPHQAIEGDCSALTTTYVSMLVSDLINANSTALSTATNGSGSKVVHINTGNQKNPPVTGGLKLAGIKSSIPNLAPLPATSSSGTTALIIVGGLAIASVGGLYLYGRSQDLTLGQATKQVWSGIKKPFQRSRK